MISGKIMDILICFLLMNVLNICLMYIVQIRSKLSQLIYENLNLLDKMHEGLIVLSRSDIELKLASRPAVRLINQLPEIDEER